MKVSLIPLLVAGLLPVILYFPAAYAQPKIEAEIVGQMSYAIGRANGKISLATSFTGYCSSNSIYSKVFEGYKDVLLFSLAPKVGVLTGSYFDLLTKRYGQDFSSRQNLVLKIEIDNAKSELKSKLSELKDSQEADEMCKRVLDQIKSGAYDPSDSILVYFTNLKKISPDDYESSKSIFDLIIKANQEALNRANAI